MRADVAILSLSLSLIEEYILFRSRVMIYCNIFVPLESFRVNVMPREARESRSFHAAFHRAAS